MRGSAGARPAGSAFGSEVRRQGTIAAPVTARAAAGAGVALLLAVCLCATVALLGGGAPPAVAEPACPNEALREEQHATYLPDCRAHEMASPLDKNGGEIITAPDRTRAAADGSAVTFTSLSGFADVVGSGIGFEYMAQRSADAEPGTSGWSTHAIFPPQESLSAISAAAGFEPIYQGDLSPDLSRGVLLALSPLTDAPEVDAAHNLYLRDDLRDPGPGSYQLLSGCPLCLSSGKSLLELGPSAKTVEIDSKTYLADASADFSRVYFESWQRLTKDALEAPAPKLYESDHGVVRLTGVLPNGTPALDSIAGSGGLNGFVPARSSHSISADGSRAVFTDVKAVLRNQMAGDLYMRINGRSTIRLSASAVEPSLYWDASTDGSRVFFSTGELLYMWKLAESDEQQSVAVDASGGTFVLRFEGASTAPIAFNASAATVQSALEALNTVKAGNVAVSGGPGSPGGAKPYLVTFGGDFAGANVAQLKATGTGLSGGASTATITTTAPVDNLTVLNADSPPGGVDGVLGASDDGHYLYFENIGQLVAGAPLVEIGLYLWHDGEIAYIGKLDRTGNDSAESLRNGLEIGFPQESRVTRDGRHLIFNVRPGKGLLSVRGGLDYDHGDCLSLVGNHHVPCREIYLYGAEDDTLVCVSCDPSGEPATGETYLTAKGIRGLVRYSDYQSHTLSEDGRFVFFTTAAALLPERDTNGKLDAYVFDSQSGEVGLLSSGTSEGDSYFVEASPDGHDAFFTTRERLAGWDRDKAYDLYDARVDGGFPEPTPVAAPCEGEGSCLEPASPAPPADPVSSAQLQGPGDPAPERCPRGKRAVKVRGKTRCVQKKGRKHRQAANGRRRAGR